ncbi:Serine carboxypeptidase-like 40, putative isoform 2 [Hibiscus syriacus]|uniref:Serine carboxypeptidase-like 40, putative isoform 2 n=1 Tax=Hibiscus syriacus TaxID=106335 RepID=A0A6A2XCP2_HIBSY|nr:Serine carboxypeptidase-like 40, putative isoform 2 [Hibiscus syriacus]
MYLLGHRLIVYGEANEAQVLDNILSSCLSKKPSPAMQFSARFYINGNNIQPQDGSMESDKISALPGQPDGVDFNQYSGYVTVDSKAGRALFYYFAKSPENSSTNPLVSWFNRGPACSSLIGAMTELGPSDGECNLRRIPGRGRLSYSNTTSIISVWVTKVRKKDAYTFLVNWLESYSILHGWTDKATTILPIIKNLMSNGIRIWLYSSDLDSVGPVTSTRYAIDKLKLPIKTACVHGSPMGSPVASLFSRFRSDVRSTTMSPSSPTTGDLSPSTTTSCFRSEPDPYRRPMLSHRCSSVWEKSAVHPEPAIVVTRCHPHMGLFLVQGVLQNWVDSTRLHDPPRPLTPSSIVVVTVLEYSSNPIGQPNLLTSLTNSGSTRNSANNLPSLDKLNCAKRARNSIIDFQIKAFTTTFSFPGDDGTRKLQPCPPAPRHIIGHSMKKLTEEEHFSSDNVNLQRPMEQMRTQLDDLLHVQASLSYSDSHLSFLTVAAKEKEGRKKREELYLRREQATAVLLHRLPTDLPWCPP